METDKKKDIKFGSNYQNNWQKSRIIKMLEILPEEEWRHKTVLELGAYNGAIGNFFHGLGADVTIVEGREANCERIKRETRVTNVICKDLDTDEWDFGHFDIIIHFGLFYHLENHFRENLVNTLEHGKKIFFETEVYDSTNDFIMVPTGQHHCGDQSLTSKEVRASVTYLENLMTKCHRSFQRFDDESLDADYHCYSWKAKEDDKYRGGQRRFWYIK